MGIEEGPLIQEGSMQIVAEPEPTQGKPQPTFQPTAPLDEAAVRAAVMQAEATGQDPTTLRVAALDEVPVPQAPVEVPEKFKKPNGEVDVDKLNASTKQLDEALQQKQGKLQDVGKSVEDALRKYKELERQMYSTPNPERIAAQIPVPPPMPAHPQEMPDAQLEAMINADIGVNPARTIAQLIRMGIDRGLQPIAEERKDNFIRENLKQLAEADPRVIQHMAAINAKLEAEPEIRRLKNPHKVAWLEVKEDLRLGELTQAQAQPSRSVAPILGGGTPPPPPSSSTGQVDINTVLAASKQLGADPRAQKKFDAKQWAKMDDVARQLFK